MADLLGLSTRIIDHGFEGNITPVNRITNELSELAPGLAIVESFSHSVALSTGDGLVCFDASGDRTGTAVVDALRSWSTERIHSIVYTHGHVDHVGGSPAFAADAVARGYRAPAVIGHDAVTARFDRYNATNGWNLAINSRQFGITRGGFGIGSGRRFLPADVLVPTQVVHDRSTITVGDEAIELRHSRGETDDHLWAWLPHRRTIMAGDFFIWNFPNAGNPQKVQRYPIEWAAALRQMAAIRADLLVPAHGLPIEGADRIGTVLGHAATALEGIVRDTLEMMNTGATLDEIIHTVKVPDDLLALPYLRPLYDEPEFVVHNVYRQFGGWWDGAPSRLKPSPDARLSTVLAELSGGADALSARALQAVADHDLRLACHLIDFAAWADPDNPAIHAVRVGVYQARRKAETSLMAKGIYSSAENESAAKATSPDQG